MKKMSELCKGGMDIPDTEIAIFIDEKSIPFALVNCFKMRADSLRTIGLLGLPCDAYLTSDFDSAFEKYKACIFIEPADTELSDRCVKKAIECQKAVIRLKEDTPKSSIDMRKSLEAAGIKFNASRTAVVYRGKKYISFYTPEDDEYDFEDNGQKTFTDLFTGEQISFPTRIKKAKCYLFERK